MQQGHATPQAASLLLTTYCLGLFAFTNPRISRALARGTDLAALRIPDSELPGGIPPKPAQ
jgi:hypothetical protein